MVDLHVRKSKRQEVQNLALEMLPLERFPFPFFLSFFFERESKFRKGTEMMLMKLDLNISGMIQPLKCLQRHCDFNGRLGHVFKTLHLKLIGHTSFPPASAGFVLVLFLQLKIFENIDEVELWGYC